MYIAIKTPRRGGMGWSGGFTVPGNTTRYSTEKCTGSAAVPMTNGDVVCAMPDEQAHLGSIGCTAIGFRGSHACQTDAGNEGAFFCCPPGVLQAELARGSGGAGGGGGMQIVSLVGVAALLGGLGFMLWRHWQREEELAREQLWDLED
jgi:hypothetical protein